jgi:hypothetical protein
MEQEMSVKFGYLEVETGYHIDFSIPILELGIPCLMQEHCSMSAAC